MVKAYTGLVRYPCCHGCRWTARSDGRRWRWWPGGGGGANFSGSLGGHDDDKDKADKSNPKERPVSGVVTDADGKPIVGAVVQLKNTRTQKRFSLMTREKGEYQFSGLSKDIDYQLTPPRKII